jgi:hypothetical protein
VKIPSVVSGGCEVFLSRRYIETNCDVNGEREQNAGKYQK